MAVGDSVPNPLRFIRLEISDGKYENGNISAATFHRIISQPASNRSSVLPYSATFLVLSDFWVLNVFTQFIFQNPKGVIRLPQEKIEI